MCLFTADRPDPSVRRQAVAAALELVDVLDAFARTHGMGAHLTRVGLAEGEVVLGNIGSTEHYEFGAVGEPLNLASRLEQLNKQLGSRILATAEIVRDVVEVAARPAGRVRVPGSQRDLSIVALGPLTQGETISV
jgi:adenylate cyclase